MSKWKNYSPLSLEDQEIERQKRRQYELADLPKRDDRSVYGSFSSNSNPSPYEEMILQDAPLDQSDYQGSDSFPKRKLTPDQQKRLSELEMERIADRETAEEILKQRGYEKYKKRGIPKSNSSVFGFKHPITRKILKSLGIVGAGLGALGSSDMSQAATDIVIPGGVEELGASEEQKALDKAYFKKLREKLK